MEENFNRIWGVIATAVPIGMAFTTLIIQAINKPNVTTTWGKVQLIIGRVFSFSTYNDAGKKAGFEFKLPVVQSAAPEKRH